MGTCREGARPASDADEDVPRPDLPRSTTVASTSSSRRDDASSLLPSLPDDVLARIFARVGDPASLARLSCVCTAWRRGLLSSGAWRMLLESRDRAPRHPRKPWRHLYLDLERKRAADVAYRHELLVLRVTMNPRPGKADEDVGAVRRDRPRRLRKLLERLGDDLRVDHESVTYGRRTLLGVAARLGSVGCARELLSHRWRANPCVRDEEGWTPLMESAFRGNEAMAVALLDAGAAASARERGARDVGKGEIVGPFTAAEWATYRGNHRVRAFIDERVSRGEASAACVRGRLVRVNATPFSI